MSTDAAGNTTTSTRTISVDTVAPTQTSSIPSFADNFGVITGTVPNNGTSDDTTPTISGTISSALGVDEVVAVYRDNIKIGIATITNTTTWSFADTGLLNGSQYNYLARVEDAAGNQGTASWVYGVTINTSVPAQAANITAINDDAVPSTGVVTSGGITNDTTPTISGTLVTALTGTEAVALYRNGTYLANANVTGTNWSFTDAGLTNNNTYTYTAQVESAAGGGQGVVGTASYPYDITIAVAPSVVITDDEPGIANIAGGSVLYTFTFSQDVTGFTVDDIVVANGTKGAFSGSGSVYTLVVTPASSFAGTMTVNVAAGVAFDAASNGNTVAIQASQVVDTLPPTAAVINSVTADNVINAAERTATVTVTGTNEAGSTVTLNGAAVTVLTPTTWSAVLSTAQINGFGEGPETLTAVSTDAAGNTTTSTRTISVDTVAPTSAGIDSVTADNVINAAERTATVTVTGTNEAGSTVTLNGAAVTVLTPTTWSAVLSTAQINGFGEGPETLTAVSTDAAGNTTTSTRTISVDTVAPTSAGIDSVTADNVINAAERTATVTVTGTNEAGSTVTLNGAAVTVLTPTTWSAVLSTAQINGFGEGPETLTAVSTDAAGNTTTSTRTISVDTVAPTSAGIDSVTADNVINAAERTATVTVTGTNEAGSTVTLNGAAVTVLTPTTWSAVLSTAQINGFGEGPETLTAVSTDAAGNTTTSTRTISVDTVASVAINPVATDNTINATEVGTTITGTTEAGATVTLGIGANTRTATVSGSNWSYTLVPADITSMGEGADTITVTATDAAGNSANTSQNITIDTAVPTSAGAALTESATGAAKLIYSESMALPTTSGFSLSLNPTSNNQYNGTNLSITGIGQGTTSGGATNNLLNLSTSTTIASTDVIRVRYDSTLGNVADLAGNKTASLETWIGGTGNSTMDLSNYGSNFSVQIRGNEGNDALTGTGANDGIIDGAGADTIRGGRGSDSIVLIENGAGALAFARDIIKVGLGDSNVGASSRDIVRGTPNTGSTGFDAKSATAADHDVLDLQSNVIAGNTAGDVNGTPIGVVLSHSITGGIVSFKTTGGAALTVNSGNSTDVVNYLQANLTGVGETVAFEMDTDTTAGVDSLVVYQNNGTLPLAGNFTLPDTMVVLAGLTGVTLGNAAGANVVQIQDGQAPDVIVSNLLTNAASGGDGLSLNFAEKAFADSNLSFTAQQNGLGTVYSTKTIEGSGTSAMNVHFTGLDLADTDWALFNYTGNTLSNGLSDSAGNVAINNSGGSFVTGGNGNNTINISALSGSISINGNAGNDTIAGNASANNINGGTGADTITGGAGVDNFEFQQGDSTTVTVNVGGDSTLNNGDTFTFAGGADIITDFSGGERINLNGFLSNYTGGSNVTWMGGTLPTNGLTTDQKFFLVQGNFSGGTFTVNNAGTDTLVVYDGDSASSTPTQTGVVLQGVVLSNLDANIGGNQIKNNTAVPPGAPNINTVAFDDKINASEQTTTITGTAEVGATSVNLTLGSGNTHVVGVDGSGNWSYTVQASDITAMGEGTETISATATKAGLTGAANTSNITVDTVAPFAISAGFSAGGSTVTVVRNEALIGTGSTNFYLSPTSSDNWGINTGSIATGSTPVTNPDGTVTVTISTSKTFAATDFVKTFYTGTNLTDAAGNALPQGESYIAGPGGSTIDLSNYGNNILQTLVGNGGADTLIATNGNDKIVDGTGADTITGRGGQDDILLQEDGTTLAYSKDTIVVGLGHSTATATDGIKGFDLHSATTANHDVLSLQSGTIAAVATHTDGADSGSIAKHSIANGIVTFEDASGAAIGVNVANLSNALTYLGQNITTPGTAVAFKADTDSTSGVDALYVFQDNGSYAPDTVIKLAELAGIANVTLSNSATPGADVLQLVDTTQPRPVDISRTANGVQFTLAETGFANSGVATTLSKNGATAMALDTWTGDGTNTFAIGSSTTTLTANDWVLMTFSGNSASNSIADAKGNFLNADVGGYIRAVGSAGDNSIDLSSYAVRTYDLVGADGNDTLIGSGGVDWIYGGKGVDVITGGAGTDQFNFRQGDGGVGVVSLAAGTSNTALDNGDTFSFAGGTDRIVDLAVGEGFSIDAPDYSNLYSASYMGSTPSNGLATNQGFFLVQGGYSGTTFTVNSSGTDTLVVYDGDSSTGVLQSGMVLSGVTVAELNVSQGSSFISRKDTTGPSYFGNSFSTSADPTTSNFFISQVFSEQVRINNVNGVSIALNPSSSNNWGNNTSKVNVLGFSYFTNTMTNDTLNFGFKLKQDGTSVSIADMQQTGFIRLTYDSSQGNITDLDNNKLSSREVYIGGSGNNTIDLSNYSNNFFQQLRGNGGADKLVGTTKGDSLVDGGGTDTLQGGGGSDSITLTENTTATGPGIATYARDTVKISLGESTSNAMDTIQASSTSPLTSGFDIVSTTAANHDVLNLQSKVIAADALHVDGADKITIKKHSITNGIVTFEDVNGTAIAINNSNSSDAIAYLGLNITTAGTTVAFKADTDTTAGVDSLFVFQDNGSIAPDTLVKMSNLMGIGSAVLGTTEGPNVVQLVDNFVAGPDIALTGNGLAFTLAETVLAPSSGNLNLALSLNGSTAMTGMTTAASGNVLSVATSTTVGATDWVLMDYSGVDATNSLSDTAGNILSPGGSHYFRAMGANGDNTINLSNAINFPSGTDYDIFGNAGNDTITGHAGKDFINGGTGADLMTGNGDNGLSDGHDNYYFAQGDSTAGTLNLAAGGNAGLLDNGDTFTFASGVDRITDFATGQGIGLEPPKYSNETPLSWMGSTPNNGVATNQKFFMVQGNLAGNQFTVNSSTGTDTLVMYDGDSTGGVTQTGIVLSGVTLTQLQAYTGGNWISHA